jgi:hypothetical protein
MNALFFFCLCALAALAAPASASADPSLSATPNEGEPGDDVTLQGRGWTNPFCESRVGLSFRQNGRKVKLGSAVVGDGRFDFMTHYQQAQPGSARFVAVQPCAGDNRIRRSAFVTIGGSQTVRYRGQTEHGGRVSFVVVDGNEVRKFRFMNRCSTDRERGSLVPGPMPIGDVSFSRHGGRFDIFGRFRASGVVKGNAHEQIMGCDSEKMTWRAERADGSSGATDPDSGSGGAGPVA